MKRISFRSLLCVAPAIVLGALSGISIAADAGQRQVVDGVAISLGALPAEMISGQPKGHHEADMHGGAPGWGEQYHIMSSLFDLQNWMPITGAEVRASVSDARTPGQRAPGPRKQLGPMTIAGGMAYGNYFNMPGTGPYRIDLEIRRPGAQQPIEAGFEYHHTVVSPKSP